MKVAKYFSNIFGTLLLIIPLSHAHASGVASTHRQSYQYIVLGDSISAGFIGYTQVAPSGVSKNGWGLKEPPPPVWWSGIRLPWIVESKRNWSWATGVNSFSIAHRLSSHLNKYEATKLRVINRAESGGRTFHIPRQTRIAVRQAQFRPHEPVELVTLMIGANDACDRLENTEFEASMIQKSMAVTFSRLSYGLGSTQESPLKVFVSSIPNIPDLGREEVLNHYAFRGLTCGDIRNRLINACPNLLNWSSWQEYETRVERVNFINEVVNSSVREAQSRYPNLSIHFDWTFAKASKDPGLLAADCFHPGREGQRYLAEQMWESMPWYSSVDTLKVTDIQYDE